MTEPIRDSAVSDALSPQGGESPGASGETTGFFEILRRRERGKLKLYIGSAAGVGKTYRMLQEAHALRQRGVDVVIGFVEPHQRAETIAQIGDLEVVPRRHFDYRGVRLEEMDVDAVIARRPEIAIVDELAHTNVPGSRNRKRWEDVIDLLGHGINVISAVNIQHLESLNDVIARTLGVTVRETIPDWVLGVAGQVVNLDISAEDLRQRLTEGRIYPSDKIEAALANFFTPENLTTLRELALREVASSVDRTREEIVRREAGGPARPAVDRLVVAMSSDAARTAALLRRASRIAGRLNSDWYCVYVQTADEAADRIDAAVQRKLVDNFQRAAELGAEVVKLVADDVAGALLAFAREKGVRLIIVGRGQHRFLARLRRRSVTEELFRRSGDIDVLVTGFDHEGNTA